MHRIIYGLKYWIWASKVPQFHTKSKGEEYRTKNERCQIQVLGSLFTSQISAAKWPCFWIHWWISPMGRSGNFLSSHCCSFCLSFLGINCWICVFGFFQLRLVSTLLRFLLLILWQVKNTWLHVLFDALSTVLSNGGPQIHL